MNVARVFVVSPFITIDSSTTSESAPIVKYFFLYSAEFGFPVHENLLKSIISRGILTFLNFCFKGSWPNEQITLW